MQLQIAAQIAATALVHAVQLLLPIKSVGMHTLTADCASSFLAEQRLLQNLNEVLSFCFQTWPRKRQCHADSMECDGLELQCTLPSPAMQTS